MTPSNHRIVVATVFAFVALAGMVSAVLSLFYDNVQVFGYGVTVMIAGAAVVLIALNPISLGDD